VRVNTGIGGMMDLIVSAPADLAEGSGH